MSQEGWWYVLAGVAIGFCISTLWEWLYFRRIRIQPQRIVEPEVQTIQTTPAPEAPAVAPAVVVAAATVSDPIGSWSTTDYQSPGVLLESETSRIVVPVPTETVSSAFHSAAKAMPVAAAVALYRAGQNGSDTANRNAGEPTDTSDSPVGSAPTAANEAASSAGSYPFGRRLWNNPPPATEPPPESHDAALETTSIPEAAVLLAAVHKADEVSASPESPEQPTPQQIDTLITSLDELIETMGNRYPDLDSTAATSTPMLAIQASLDEIIDTMGSRYPALDSTEATPMPASPATVAEVTELSVTEVQVEKITVVEVDKET